MLVSQLRPLCSLVSLRAFLKTHAQGSSASGSASRWCQTWRRYSTGGARPSSTPPSRTASSAAEGGALAEADTLQDILPQRPQAPLCERSPEHSAELGRLLAWLKEALQAISVIGDAWAQQDDGPSQADLETELSWLLDDAVAGIQASSGQVRSTTWRMLELELRRPQQPPGVQQQVLQLRAPLEALASIWRCRLEHRAPLQYLTSSAHWRDIVLSVGPGILIPRPETEQMVDFVAETAAADPWLAEGPWADLGTGSGALAIGVARQLPGVKQVWAVDISPSAVAYATFNAQRLGVSDRVTVLSGSWYEPLLQAGVRQLAGIVSNPPYILAAQMPGLQAEVGRHEPHLALDGGEGLGLDSLLPICEGAVALLQPGGFLALETGGGEQAQHVAGLLREMRDAKGGTSSQHAPLAFTDVQVRHDLFGVGRFVQARRARRQQLRD